MRGFAYTRGVFALLLSGCSLPASQTELHETKTSQPTPSISATVPASVTPAQNSVFEHKHTSAAVKLYEAIKRLNAACVNAGGGVSGSPDCDAGTAKEEQLEKLGYCIDYPNNEKLARCVDVKWRP